MTEYSIIIPAYNEEEVIFDVVKKLDKPDGCHEIIVINDGSSDKTRQEAERAGARVIDHPMNKGYGAALKTGILNAKTEYVICYDGDGQHKRQDLIRIAEIADKHDMVVGARTNQAHSSWIRMPGKWFLGVYANILVDKKIPDLNSGLRSFKVSTIKQYLHLMPDGFSLSTTSTIAMFRMGYDVKYIPITIEKRQGRPSSVKMIRDGMRVFMLILNLTVLFNPMRVFFPVSMASVCLGILYFIINTWIVGRLMITASMVFLFITGVLIFFMGVICEQISAIRRELHH